MTAVRPKMLYLLQLPGDEGVATIVLNEKPARFALMVFSSAYSAQCFSEDSTHRADKFAVKGVLLEDVRQLVFNFATNGVPYFLVDHRRGRNPEPMSAELFLRTLDQYEASECHGRTTTNPARRSSAKSASASNVDGLRPNDGDAESRN